MLEAKIDLWDPRFDEKADARVILTNGSVKANGKAVMGRGSAGEAAERYPRLPDALGTLLRTYGNHTHYFPGYRIITLPTKHEWHDERADLKLIFRSLDELLKIVTAHEFQHIVMPQPGTGNGKLLWYQVRPLLAERLDNRFLVLDYPLGSAKRYRVDTF